MDDQMKGQAAPEMAAPEQAAMTPPEQPAAQDEHDRTILELMAQVTVMTRRAAEAELKAAAMAAGIPEAKLPYALKMCDRDALYMKGADMTALATEQVAALIRGVPELVLRPVAGSLGDHRCVDGGLTAEDAVRGEFTRFL